MTFDDIRGNDALIQKLTAAIGRGHISHAYIFEGDFCVDKNALGDCFAKAILCEARKGRGCDDCIACRKIDHQNHEDLIYAEAVGSSVKDEAVEALQARLKNKPYGERTIAIIKNADTMTPRAQNRLLKTLEEPSGGTVIVLLAENIENLAPTILSRCITFHFNPFFTRAWGEMIAEADAVMALLTSGAPFYRTKARVMALAEERDGALQLLDALESIFSEFALGKKEMQAVPEIVSVKRAVAYIEEARRDLLRGMNIGYTLKSMILNMEDIKW